MSGYARVLLDESPLSRIDRALYKVESTLSLLCGFAVFSLTILAVVSVGGRNFFNRPVSGYVDWIEQIMPLIAFLGVAYTQRDGGHIRMDMLIGQLRGRGLWLAESLSTFAALVLMTLLVWGSFAHFQRSFDFGAPLWSRDSSIDIALPIWPSKLIVPLAFSMLCLRLGLQLWSFLRAALFRLDSPVAVPLPADRAKEAARGFSRSDSEQP